MKPLLLSLTGCLVWWLPLAAQQLVLNFDYGGAPVVVPDGDLVGVSDTTWVNEASLDGFKISAVKVLLTLSGGWNGDIYAQLNHNGQFSVLLNRPGVSPTDSLGYSDAGFSVSFADEAASGDVHRYGATLTAGGMSLNGAPLTGTWAPDGRPYGQAEAADPSARTALLSQFDNMIVNGNWTLLLADLSPVGETQLLNWGLEISYVPEPAGLALGFATGLLLWAAWRGNGKIRRRSA